MKGIIAALGALGAGAALMYFFDPNDGGRRRALIRDKAVGLSNDLRDTVDKQVRDLSNRTSGALHQAKGLIAEAGSNQQPETAERTA